MVRRLKKLKFDKDSKKRNQSPDTKRVEAFIESYDVKSFPETARKAQRAGSLCLFKIVILEAKRDTFGTLKLFHRSPAFRRLTAEIDLWTSRYYLAEKEFEEASEAAFLWRIRALPRELRDHIYRCDFWLRYGNGNRPIQYWNFTLYQTPLHNRYFVGSQIAREAMEMEYSLAHVHMPISGRHSAHHLYDFLHFPHSNTGVKALDFIASLRLGMNGRKHSDHNAIHGTVAFPNGRTIPLEIANCRLSRRSHHDILDFLEDFWDPYVAMSPCKVRLTLVIRGWGSRPNIGREETIRVCVDMDKVYPQDSVGPHVHWRRHVKYFNWEFFEDAVEAVYHAVEEEDKEKILWYDKWYEDPGYPYQLPQ